MRASVASELVQSNGTHLELRDDYGGRGMMDETTAGIVGSIQDLLIAVSVLSPTLSALERCDLEEDLRLLRTDNMGLSTIFY